MGSELEKRSHFLEIDLLEVNHDVPSEIGDTRGDALHRFLRRELHEAFDEIEPNATYPCGVELVQLRVRDVFIDECDPSGSSLCIVQRIHQRTIVGIVARGLNDDVLLESQEIPERKQGLFGRITRRVFALRREWEDRVWAKYVLIGVGSRRRSAR